MIVRLKTHLTALEQASAAQTAAAAMREQLKHVRAQLEYERKEVRRLTDVVIALKREDYQVQPQYADERWGSYTLDEADARAAASSPRVGAAPEPVATEEAAIAEQEIRAELEAVFAGAED